jgi:LPXTG-site transpeptidase (sortase) family protein
MAKSIKRTIKRRTGTRKPKNVPKISRTDRLANQKTAIIGGLVFVAIGLAVAGYSLINTMRSQETATAAVPLSEALQSPTVPEDKPSVSGTPSHITIPSVNINLKVIPGNYYPANNSWTLTRDNAQWGTITQPANDKAGMTFIYAHYRKGVFLTLPKIKVGETAVVKTEQGNIFTYRFKYSTVTKPSDTSIFTYQGQPILVLQTCTGAWYQDRQLFFFDLEKVE